MDEIVKTYYRKARYHHRLTLRLIAEKTGISIDKLINEFETFPPVSASPYRILEAVWRKHCSDDDKQEHKDNY
jgi:hypothetical protein